MRGDGDGWSRSADGSTHWGRHGAAGLLLRAPGVGGACVLLQHRVAWSHHGGTWGLPGGARDSHETPVQAALREADEEAGVRAVDVAVRGQRVTAVTAQGWTYTSVVADAPRVLPLAPNHESAELRWVGEPDVDALALHPGLADAWTTLRAQPLRLLMDTANVLGARPNGWWRDRAAATGLLLGEVAAAFPRTVELAGGGFGWVSGVDAVLEGAARAVQASGVVVHRAPASGDDELVRVVDDGNLVVTADRGLRARLPASVAVVGPHTLLGWLGAAG